MAGRKVFTRATLASADVNDYLMDQAVMSFPSAAARDTAIPTPVAGMHCVLTDQLATLRYLNGAWGPVDALPVATMASRPTTGRYVGQRIRPLDNPHRTYVWNGTVWVQDGTPFSTLSGIPAGGYLTQMAGSTVLTTGGSGGFSIPIGHTYSAAPGFVLMTPGDNSGGLASVSPIVANHTATALGGQGFAVAAALASGIGIRVNWACIGYNS